MKVHKTLGCGFLETVYDDALAVEFGSQQINFKRQVPYHVYYKNKLVGKFVADYVIEDRLILELKALRSIPLTSHAQLINYLHASGLKVGLLLNFGVRSLEIKRLVNDYQTDQAT